MKAEYDDLKKSLISIATEMFRFQGICNRVISKLPLEEQPKYSSQFAWFSKQVTKALSASGLRIVDLTGEKYDPGIAATPINLDDFNIEDHLYIEQMLEPVIMDGENVIKTGTVLLEREDS